MLGDLTTLDVVKQWLNVTGLAISAITNANPGVVTLAAVPNVPLTTGLPVGLSAINGMTQLNDQEVTITVLTPTTFSIGIDTTGFGAYTSGGLASVSDSLLSRLITAVSTYVQSWMNRKIPRMTYVETRNGLGGPVMLLKNFPVLSVSALTVDGVAMTPRGPISPYVPGPTGYTFDDISIQLPCGFPRGFQNVTVTYDAGYDTVPADIEQAVVDTIGEWFYARQRIGILSKAIEGQSITFMNQSMPQRAKDVLQQYKQMSPIPT